MKPTPFLKRVLSPLFSGICLAALTLGSASQLAMAAVTISSTTESLSGYSEDERSTSDDYVLGSRVMYGYVMQINDSATLTNLDADITANYTSSNDPTETYAVYNSGTIANVAESVTITATASSDASVGELTGLYIAEDASITNNMAATITVSNSSGNSTYGICNEGTIGGAVSGNISVTSTVGNLTYGIITYGTITGDVSGDITINNSSGYAYGIYNHWSNIDGAISGDIIVSSTGGSYSYGILNNGGTIGDISGDITVSSSSEDAIRVFGVLEEGDGIGTISSNISAEITTDTTPDGSTAAALYYNVSNSSQTVIFADGASLSASGAATNYAIYTAGNATTKLTLTATTSTAQISLTGDISANSGALSIESGNYVLEGDSTTITASSMSISSGASLTLTGDTTFTITDNTLVLNVTGEVTQAMLIISETGSITNLATSVSDEDEYGIASINDDTFTITINLDEDAAAAYTAGTLAIFDEDTAASLTEASINIYVGDTLTYENVSATTLTGTFATIPEPSTATLSLLALAGLCARRRRKAA